MSNRTPKQAKLETFFSLRKHRESTRVKDDDDEVLQAPSVSTMVGVVFESCEEYVLGKTIDSGYVLEIHAEITEAVRYTSRLLTSESPRTVSLLDTIRQKRQKFLTSWLHRGVSRGAAGKT